MAVKLCYTCKTEKDISEFSPKSSEYNLDDVSKGIAIVLCANCHSLFHAHFGGKSAHFPDQTKESTVEIIKLQRGLKGV